MIGFTDLGPYNQEIGKIMHICTFVNFDPKERSHNSKREGGPEKGSVKFLKCSIGDVSERTKVRKGRKGELLPVGKFQSVGTR